MRVGLGFFCSTSDNKLSTNHKLRLSSLNEENLFRIFQKNFDDFIKLLELSRSLGLSIFRLGSNFVPFASHPLFKQSWLKKIEETLVEKSSLVKSFGVRITMHPGQYVVLNSPSADVRVRSLRELEYHFRVLDWLGLGRESVVVVHAGGVYGSKSRALKNLYEVLEENKWLLNRIALENDERHYTVQDVLEVAESFKIPVVYDHYHHKLNPSKFSVDRLVSTWRGIPLEVHVSSSPDKPHRYGEHGEYLRVEDFIEALSIFPKDTSVDVIIEAKMKEKAITRLIEELKREYPQILNLMISTLQ